MRKVSKINTTEANRMVAPKLRTAAYCRVSTDSDEQLLSLEAQKQHYEAFIKANTAWEFAGLYYDEGISGTKKENRDDLQRLLRDCELRKIDFIITKSISRFARNTTDCLEIVRSLAELGVFIFFEKENINTGTMDSELVLTVLSSLAENESVSISENNKWGIKRRFQNGTYKISTPPYGYLYQDGTLVPHPEQAAVAKRIFVRALAGDGTAVIAKGLNADGIRPVRGSVWGASAIRGILTNEKYTGDALFQKTYTDESFNRHVNRGDHEQYYVQNNHEALVSHEDFEAVSRALTQRGHEKGIQDGTDKYAARYAFSGTITCEECASTFKRRIHLPNKPGQYVAWCCGKHITAGARECSMLFIRDEHIKAAFVRMMNRLYSGRSIILKPLIQGMKEQDTGGIFSRLRELENKLEENMERARMLVEFMTKGYLDPALFNAQSNDLKAEAARLKEQKTALAASITGNQSAVAEAEALFKYLQKGGGILEEFDEELFGRFVAGITVFSPTELGFRMKCGICLRERMAR